MNLYEYQAKQPFTHRGLLALMGYARTTPREAEEAVSKVGAGPWAVKCQIHASGRGKVGGVKVVNSKEDIRAFTENWLGRHLVTYQTDANGQPVNQILVRAATDIAKEPYLGVVVGRSSRHVVFMASTEGGVETKKMAEETPRLVYRVALGLLTDLMPYQGRELAFKLGLESRLIQQFTEILVGLAAIFLECDLALVEINPLVITKQGGLTCLDGELGANGNALSRQPDLREIRDQSQEDPREAQAVQWELNYVALDDNIGCMVNGVGLAMGTTDIVELHGGESTNFLDVGGGTTKERVTEASRTILSDDKVKAVLANVFGGIIRCDLIADGIIGAAVEVGASVSVVVCPEGNNVELGARKLADSDLNIVAVKGLTGVAQQVVAAVKGK